MVRLHFIARQTIPSHEAIQTELKSLRAERKNTKKKVTIESLAEGERPTQLLPLNKMLTDSVKMIAYRSETALVGLLRRYLNKEDEARALIRELFVSSADIVPDELAQTLTIRIHRMASPVHDMAIGGLLEELTKQEFQHPETGAKWSTFWHNVPWPIPAESRSLTLHLKPANHLVQFTGQGGKTL